MELTPADYRCDVHQQDLTELVREQLTTIITASFARATAGRDFRVIVTCPGANGQQGTAHDVACTGSRT
jgi:hypothetical protein